MSKNIILLHGSSSRCLEEFKERFADKSIRKVTCFLDHENFILSEYYFDIPGISMVVECDDNCLIYIMSLNCGYGMNECYCTCQLLRFIGIDQIFAERLSYKPGFCVEKTEKLWVEKPVVVLFAQRSNDNALGIFKLDNSVNNVDVTNRHVTMIQPQQHDLCGLISCINAMRIEEIIFNFGKKESIYPDIIPENFTTEFCKNYNEHKFNGVNLIMHGAAFSIFCFVKCDELITLANVLHTYILGKPLFTGGVYGDIAVMSKSPKSVTKATLLRNLFLCNKKVPKIIYRIQVGDHRGI